MDLKEIQKRRKKIKIPYHRIPDNICSYVPREEVEPNPSLPYVCNVRSAFLPKRTVWEGEESRSYGEKPDRHCLSQEVKVNMGSAVIACTLGMECVVTLRGPPPQSCVPSLIVREKKSDRSQLTDSVPCIWPVPLETVKVIKNKDSLRHRHSREDPNER